MSLVNALPFRWRDVEGRWAQVHLHLHASLQVWIKGGALKVEPKLHGWFGLCVGGRRACARGPCAVDCGVIA